MDVNGNEYSFDEIRPFEDHEVKPAIQRLVEIPSFHTALQYIFPETPLEHLIAKLKNVNTIAQFQKEIIAPAVNVVKDSSTDGLTLEGLDALSKEQAYLFISNHRDIVLDSAFLNMELFRHDFTTTKIAIGSNLLQKPWIEDLVKLNKNFIVHRNVHSRQAYEYSLRLSKFISQSIIKENVSVWIAQKEGRTKDGRDRTQAGLIKMFGMSSDAKDFIETYSKLNIAPVSLSYEIEPCGGMKAREKFILQEAGVYQKEPREDLISMQKGISNPKGKVHYAFSQPMEREMIEQAFASGNKNESVRKLAAVIDNIIIKNYKLFPNNYIAYDLINNSNHFNSHYNASDVDKFNRICHSELIEYPDQKDSIYPFLLNIYANPVNSKIEKGFVSL